MKKTDKKAFKKLCHTVREDGVYIEAGENDNLIISKLEENPKAFGVFGYSFLDQNKDKLQGSIVEDNAPTFENIRNIFIHFMIFNIFGFFNCKCSYNFFIVFFIR